jgi:hypothetical protein
LGGGIGVVSLVDRFLEMRFAALRTCRASFSSLKIVLRGSMEDFDISDALLQVSLELLHDNVHHVFTYLPRATLTS